LTIIEKDILDGNYLRSIDRDNRYRNMAVLEQMCHVSTRPHNKVINFKFKM